MALGVEEFGDVTVVAIKLEQFDAAQADAFKQEIAPVLDKARKLVLDLGSVQFVDSRACGAILSCVKRMSEVGGELKLCQVTPFVRSVFELIRMHRICDILATREAAVAAYNA